MTANLEREIKLRFDTPDQARAAVSAVGARPLRARRLQDDRLVDWPDKRLRQHQSTLRVRQEDGATTLTFKGPPQSTTMKVREEIETTAGDASSLMAILERLGLRVWFQYQKYRQEYASEGVVLAIDETPVGTFAELEGDEEDIRRIASVMGRSQTDYILDSYRELFIKARGSDAVHMVFET